jgi:gamma-glutamyltranspeptidase / glutathione hydrolase
MRWQATGDGSRTAGGARAVARGGLWVITLAAMGLAGLGAQQPPQQPTEAAIKRADTLRPEILGTRGIVAAGRHYSVSAGVRILQQGGNAVDAGVASVLAASIC